MKKYLFNLVFYLVMLFAGPNLCFATIITGGAFNGWDADPISAISVSGSGVATLLTQAPDYASTIYLSRSFTGVSSISFDVNFIDGGVPDQIPSYLQVSFVSKGNQTDFLGYDRNGVYNPTTLANIGSYGSWFSDSINNLGGVDGTLYFILQYEGDDIASVGQVRNVSVSEKSAVPEPPNILLIAIGGILMSFSVMKKRQAFNKQ